MTLDAIRAAFPAYPANESPVAIAYGEMLGRARDDAASDASRTNEPDLAHRLAARWRSWLQEREEHARLDALGPLAPYLLRDIGVTDEFRSIALARRDSHAERAIGASDIGSISGRFGSW